MDDGAVWKDESAQRHGARRELLLLSISQSAGFGSSKHEVTERQYETPSSAFAWSCGELTDWARSRKGATAAGATDATYVICRYRHHAPALLHPSSGKQLLRGLLLFGAASLTADST